MFNLFMDIFDKIKDVFGSQSALAGILGVDPMTISQWKARGRIPAERCPEISAASGGKILPSEMRPDLYGSPEQAA